MGAAHGTPEYDRILADRRRRSRAARLGWIRSKRRAELQGAILQAIDAYRDEGYTFAIRWPGGAVVDRGQIANLLYWKLVEQGVLQGESAIGYEELDDGRA